ncbi:DUF2913 family protein [Shewanella sp. NIFS-20-20]|uniref:DUF2913 family protein n=1 Tax=Shewanella sp. NIFS-20-20 TaxID=2853806 RepID=UPI001C485D43|nr:DUF2913 family protein [Shewanella sp. NIFS-20-20]MBV7314490.1 DUF2913 family protein [Shewanella sp. NIFS-20-20]
MSYNQAVYTLAQDGLAALAQSALAKKQATPAQESHFLCNWMAESLKKKAYPKCLAKDLTGWIRDGRSMGAGAQLTSLLQRIEAQYRQVAEQQTGLGKALMAWLDDLQAQGVLVITDTDVNGKLKLDNDGLPSVIISASALAMAVVGDELTKPLALYIRADEAMLARSALAHGLLLSQGNKKTTLVKHHKTFQVFPNNAQPELVLLVAAL